MQLILERRSRYLFRESNNLTRTAGSALYGLRTMVRIQESESTHLFLLLFPESSHVPVTTPPCGQLQVPGFSLQLSIGQHTAPARSGIRNVEPQVHTAWAEPEATF